LLALHGNQLSALFTASNGESSTSLQYLFAAIRYCVIEDATLRANRACS